MAKRKEPEGEMTIRDLAQLRVLADPLRTRILETLGEERTTKQVAQLLGERPTRLYHHVDALEKAGLVRRTRTRQNRGTLEKYYIAVARTFRADPSLFRGAEREETDAALGEIVDNLMDSTGRELRRVLAAERSRDLLEEQGMLTYLEVRATQDWMDGFRAKLAALVQETTESVPASDAEERRYRLTLAFFPLDGGGVPKKK